jgi:PAS domain S-box-containing protein
MAKKNKSTKASSHPRERAEQTLDPETVSVRDMSEEQVAALVHELRVHQVELEMQNESLRQAQVDLEQSRTKYAELFDFAPVGYLVFDHNAVVIEANLTAVGMLQVERGQLIGTSFSSLFQPSSRDQWLLHYKTVFKSGQPQECELELKRKDKAQVVVRLRSEPVKNEVGEVIECRTTMTNVTALARVERRLKDSERRFRTLAENAPDIIARLNEEMRILYVNRPVENVLGIPPSEFVGQTIDDLGLPDELVRTWTREIQEVFRSGKVRHIEFNYGAARGTRHYSAILVPEFEEERAVGTVLVTVRDVTERVEAEERYSTIIRTSQEGFCILDCTGRYIEVNDSCCRMLGHSREELLTMTFLDVMVPEQRQIMTERMAEALKEGYGRFHTWHLRPDDQRVDCDISVQRFNGDHILVMARDVTEQYKAQEERLESLRRLELVAAATNDGIWDIDLATDTLWHNEAYATAFGYASAEPISLDWWRERLHPEDRDQVLSTFDSAIQEGRDRWMARYRFRRKDGSYAWVMARGYVLRDEQGKALRITGSMTDLTEKLELLDQLESERAKLAAILETAQSGIIVVDAQGRPTYANPVLKEIHQRPIPVGGGVESHGQLGLLHLDGTPYEPQELPLVRAATNGETINEVEMLIERPDGQRRHLLTNASPLRDSQGNILGAVAIVQDITELKAAEQALRQARDELEERVRQRTTAINETVGELQQEVAEKMEAQTQLTRQNEILQKIIGSIPVMLCFYDSQGNVAMINNEFERVLGYSLKDVQKSDPMELLYPDPDQQQEARQYMLSGEPGWRDFLVQRKRGGKVLSSWANIRLPDDSYIGIGIDIRERQRFESRLRESEERYRTLVELSPDAIAVERNGEILFVNSTAVRLAGTEKAEDLIGRPIIDFLHPDYREQAQEQLATIRRERVPLPPTEKKILRLDGGLLDVEVTGMPIMFEGGPAIQLVMHDITERKRAEDRLRHSAWQLQQQAELLNLAHDTIMVHDMDGRITFWNRGAEQTYGWAKEETLGKVSHELLRTRFPHNLMEITAMLLSQGRWDGELTHTTRSNETIIVSSRWALQRDENDQPAAILVIDRDITQQKRAEMATSEARRFAESVIDTVQEALLVLDADMKVISANHTFYDTFQITPEDTHGRYVYEIDHGQWNIPELRRLLEDILPHDTSFESFEVEHEFQRIGRRTMVLNARRIYHETQETEMILLAMQDITIRKRQEREIHKHQQQLASLTEELLLAEERERHRLAVMLHDSIGQSLAFSRRELGVLQKRVPAQTTEIIESIKEQIDVAIHQTRDLTFELSPTTLHTFGLEAAIEELGDQFAQREGFTLRFEATEETLPLTEQIKTLLYRATRELLMNIAKHADAHSVSVRIDQVDNRIRIRVADDGRGFDVSAMKDVTGEQQGFGIFSIRERLTNVGGSFHIASEPGKGTEVTLIAPLDAPRDTDKRSGTP